MARKFNEYLEAKQYMPGYENAEIGFHFKTPGADPAFKAAVEAEIARLQGAHPNITIRIKWE